MDEKTRMARYEAQRGGGAETPAQRRRRLHKRGHQMRQANLRKVRKPRDLALPRFEEIFPAGQIFTPYRVGPPLHDPKSIFPPGGGGTS